MIRLVSDSPRKALGIDDARDAAKAAFAKARKAQVALVANLNLTARLYEPGTVNYYKLKGMRNEAQKQADRAQAVVDALNESIEAMEAAK